MGCFPFISHISQPAAQQSEATKPETFSIVAVTATTAQITTQEPNPRERQEVFCKANTLQAQNEGTRRQQRDLCADIHLGDNTTGAALTSN